MKWHLIVVLALVSFLRAASLENEFIRLNVHPETGIFNLGTVDDEPLIDGYPDQFDKAFFIINYDGVLLTNFPDEPETAPLLDTTTLWEDRYITTEWAHDDLQIWQKLRFLEEDSLRRFLNIELLVYNEGDSHSVGIQYLMDMRIGDNDNPGVAVPWESITDETIYTDPMPGYISVYQDIAHHDTSSLFAMGIPYGRDLIMPDVLAIANSTILDDITFDVHITGAELFDAALLLRWNDLIVHPTGMQVIEFNWGLPYPGFDSISEITKIRTIPNAMELELAPNPFNSKLAVNLYNHFPVNKKTTIEIFSIDGKWIDILYEGEVEPGQNQFFWTPERQPSGIYLIVQRSGKIHNTKRAIYMK